MIDKRIEDALRKHGYQIYNEKRADHNNLIYETDKGYVFVKRDARPWWKPLDVSSRGAGIGVFASAYRNWIQPHHMHFLYHYKDEDRLYFVNRDKYLTGVEHTHQNDGQEVWVFPFSDMHSWDLPEDQMTLV